MRPGCIAAIGAILGIIIGLYLKSIALLLCVGFIIIIYIKHNKNIRILMFFIIIFLKQQLKVKFQTTLKILI